MQGYKIAKAIIVTLSLLISMPILVVLLSWWGWDGDIWQHFYNNLLGDLLTSTLSLLIGVALGVTILGTTLAYLVVMVEFPGRKYLEWLLFLPFVIPAYVLAFVYLGIFDYSGYVQVFIREHFSIKGFDIRSGDGAVILTFVLAFYPYVYMLTRASFKKQKINMLETATLLGANHWYCFRKISIPMVRPAIAAGVLITMMETLADFGVVSVFNYDSFTTVIYSAWIDYRSIQTSSQLASLLVLLAFLMIYFEKKFRGESKYYSTEVLENRYYKPNKLIAFNISVFVWLVFIVSFILPIVQLLFWAFSGSATLNMTKYLEVAIASLLLIIFATTISILISLFLALGNYYQNTKSLSFIIRLSTLGYALPGSVMAIGLLFFVDIISKTSIYFSGSSINHIVFGSVTLLLFAYTSRFLAIGYNSIDSSVNKIKPIFTQNATLLSPSTIRTILKVQLPMILPGIITGGLLVAVDVMKELPATYLLRPFGWDTLAINIYELSSEGLFEQAAIPSLIIILLALVLILVAKALDKSLFKLS